MVAFRRGAPWLSSALVLIGTSLAVVGLLAAAVGALEPRSFGLVALVVAGASFAYAAWYAPPSYVFSLAIALSVISGNWDGLGFQGGAAPDRFVLLVGFLALLLRAPGTRDRPPLKVSPAHWALGMAVLYAALSSVIVGTFLTENGGFRLLDRLGVVPFVMFAIAPLVFRTERDREVLLATLVFLGGYLGLTALFETVGPKDLVFPQYILDSRFGIHLDRARGPFVEAEANGLALYGCGVAAVIAAATWRRPIPRISAGAIAALCALGTLLTLQRAVWIGAVLATAVALLSFRGLRRFLVPALVAVPLIAITAFTFVPGLGAQATERKNAQRPIWDRKNLNSASLRMVEAKPLLGFGWGSFEEESAPFFEQADDYPLTGTREPIHNVFLSNAVELGLLGTALWALALVLAVGGAIVGRAPPSLRPWQVGLVAYSVMWATVANLTPLQRPFVTILLLTWAGVVWAGRYATEPTFASGVRAAPTLPRAS